MIKRLISLLFLAWVLGFAWFALLLPLPAGDQTTVDINVHGIPSKFIQRNYGAAFQTKHLIEVHLCPAQLNLQIEFDIPQQIERCVLGRGRRAWKLFQLKFRKPLELIAWR